MSILKLQNYLRQIDESLLLAETQKEKLEYLVEIGRLLKSDTWLTTQAEFKVPGCASNTFVKLDKNSLNLISLSSYTDSYIVAGYLFIFENALNNLEISDLEVATIELKNWLHKNKFDTGIVPTRIDASGRIIEKILSFKP